MNLNSLAALCLILSPATAQAIVYDCTVNPGSANGGYITEHYFLNYDAEAKTLEVFDGLINHSNDKKPLAAKISRDTDAQLAFSWKLNVLNSASQRSLMDFRSVFYRQTGEFAVSAQPHGYRNKYSARGTCALAK